MKQKQLLIAFGALVLSACGGSLDLGPKIPAPPITEPEEPVGRELVHYPISMETDAEWESRANWENEDDVAPSLEYIENGIQIYSTNPNQQMLTQISGPLDAREGTMVFTISADADYLATASGVQPFQHVYTRDPSGNSEDDEGGAGNWGCFTGTGEWEADTEVEVTCNVPAAEAYDLAEDQYMNVGIQSQGADVEGYLRLHNIEFHYWVGEPEEDTSSPGRFIELDMTEGWFVGDDLAGDDAPNPNAVDYTSEGVGFAPTFEGEWSPKLFFLLDGPVDLAGKSFTVEFTVEQALLDLGASVSAHAQLNFDNYAQHQCAVDNEDLTAGEPFTVTCEDLPDTMVADEGESLRIGIEIGGGSAGDDAGTITIHSVTYEGESSALEVATDESANNDTGEWSVSDDSANIEYKEEGVAFTPVFDVEWGAKLVYLLNGPVDLTGQSFTVEFMVDQAFFDAGVSIAVHAQQAFGDHTQHQCEVDNGDLEPGVPFSVTCEELPDAIAAEEGETLRFGVAFSGDAEGTDDAGTVTITRLTIGD